MKQPLCPECRSFAVVIKTVFTAKYAEFHLRCVSCGHRFMITIEEGPAEAAGQKPKGEENDDLLQVS